MRQTRRVFLQTAAAGGTLLVALLPPYAISPGIFPFTIAGVVILWILLARVLSGGNFAKVVLLLSFVLATLLLMWGLFYNWERNNWGWGFLSSLLATGAFYLLFEVGLGLRFPHGLFP